MSKMFIFTISSSFVAVFAASLLKTGQSSSYAAYDDGYYQKGEARSYSRVGDTVKDNVTKLQWQDDSETSQVQKRWYDAKVYCSELQLETFSDWRVPTIEEFETLVDDGQYDPSVTPGVFQHIVASVYWSDTTYDYRPTFAWGINFQTAYSYHYEKEHEAYVRCVRTSDAWSLQ